MSFNWIVSQIGARQHFGVPRGFIYRDELRLLYTDAWCRTGRSLLRRGPRAAKAFAGRYHPDVPNSKVISFNLGSMLFHIKRARAARNIETEFLQHTAFGQWFSTQVANDLVHRQLSPESDLFFGFNTGCLETITLLRQRNITTVVDQMDPARVEEQLVFEESERWPGWQKLPGRIPEVYWQRMDAEWAATSMVLVNSEWSRQALISQGVTAEKIAVIPPSYEPEKLRLPERRNLDKPITVLWLGLVNLRKGIQYLIEAAHLLAKDPSIRFVIAGPIQISEQAVKSAPPNMQFLGKVSRFDVAAVYQQADVFVLPTVSDGFAVAQLEAMSRGLPVIVTPNCGEVVTNGVDGFIVPVRSGQAIAQAIQRLNQDRQLLRELSYRALDKSTHFYLPRQVQRLEEALAELRQGRSLETAQFPVFKKPDSLR